MKKDKILKQLQVGDMFQYKNSEFILVDGMRSESRTSLINHKLVVDLKTGSHQLIGDDSVVIPIKKHHNKHCLLNHTILHIIIHILFHIVLHGVLEIFIH